MDFDYTELEDCRCFLVRKSARFLTQRYERAIASSGLKSTQFTLLSILRCNAAMTITQLAKSIGSDRTTLTRNLQPMERDGFVKIESGKDNRERLVSITDLGIERHGLALKPWKEVQDRVKEALGPGDWDHMGRILNKLQKEI